MTNETKKRIHLIYGIVLSIVAVIAGVCFILSALHIYRTGLATSEQAYTVQTISAAFSKISIPVYLCLALVIGGWILNIVLPLEKSKPKAERNQMLVLQRLQARTDLAACPEDLRNAIAMQENARKTHWLISSVLLTAAAALFLSYACNGNNWASVEEAAHINTCMVRAAFALLICLAIPFIYIVFTVFFCRSSLNKQIELMRQASTVAPFKGEKQPVAVRSGMIIDITRYAILAISLGLIIWGACNEGTLDVLAKAAAICTECVGLG